MSFKLRFFPEKNTGISLFTKSGLEGELEGFLLWKGKRV
jgi:hypothetical protein